jgi:menaquinone-9 beta-reductase
MMLEPIVEEAEVVVVGGGPSGSSAADRLMELGHDVLLIDQSGFPRDKPCGDGLTHAAVATLQRRGFGELLSDSQPIEDVRVVLGDGRLLSGWYRPWPQPPSNARTVPRRALDSALFDRARAQGARFLQARVDAPLMENGEVRGVALTGGAGNVRARCVIAADGATSRIRREAGFPKEPLGSHIYALRLYASTEQSLDPVFDVYVPLLYDGGLLAGYGWVFPVAERRANVGVAYYEPPLGRPRAKIRRVLDSFLAYLEAQSSERFGRFSERSEPIGAPIATQFSPERSQLGRLVFAGEAARAADPLSGEGISFALESGEMAADEAHALLRGVRMASQGTLIARKYTRLGQDLALPARLAAAATTGLSLVDRTHLPYVHKVQRVTSFAPDDPVLRGTDLYDALSAAETSAAAALDRVNETLLDLLSTRFPFALEVSHREARASGGPFAASLTLATSLALAGEITDAHVDAAAAVEALSLVGGTYSNTAEGTTSEAGRVNNMLATLSGEFLICRALEGATRSGNLAASAMPGTARALLECQWREAEDLGVVHRSPERYREGTGRGIAMIAALAVELGASPGNGDGIAKVLADASAGLATAWQTCNEIRALTIGDEVLGMPPGDDLRARRMTLPLIFAVSADPTIGEGLEGRLDAVGTQELLARVRASGGLDQAAEECAAGVRAWENGLDAAGVGETEVLTVLGKVCLDRLPGSAVSLQ